ncbi:flagellar basal body L-ring protein FlgH [Novosphingopyxis sp.]|uniref:flagellar basal body L-ring protein FlgH n=1 Tax=Novosphingopyxis sp. TaxID=2709690 RepID=UPI003B5BB431
MKTLPLLCCAALLAALPASARADNLYRGGSFPSLATDLRASQVGDLVTVIIYQRSSATTTAQQSSNKRTDLQGDLDVGGIDEGGRLRIGGGYAGRGEARRSEQLATTISVSVSAILPNGDFLVEGRHDMLVNGEKTLIGLRGRVRPQDIGNGNVILSSRIADAQIEYDGKGYVSRSAKPGLINRIFSFLGLG